MDFALDIAESVLAHIAVAVEAVVGKVIDIVVVAEVVANIVAVVRRMAVLVAWLHLPYSPLRHVVPTLCAFVCSCC